MNSGPSMASGLIEVLRTHLELCERALELITSEGRSLAGQAVSVLTAITAGSVVYAGTVWVLGVPEARQIPRLLVGRDRS